MPFLRFVILASALVLLTGCTEMRVEGDAKVFQSSALGSTIRVVIGIGLLGLGAVAIAGSVWPDRKNGNRTPAPHEKLSTSHRAGLALFGFAMALVGLFLAAITLVFPSKLHVTVYPDRVAMASTYSQTGGKEVVVPYSDVSSVEIRDEVNIVGKPKKFLVFTTHRGPAIKQPAGNNEMQAIDTIRQALADYQAQQPAIAATPDEAGERSLSAAEGPGTRAIQDARGGMPPLGQPDSQIPVVPPEPTSPPPAAPPVTTASEPNLSPPAPPSAPTTSQYSLKRYPITIPLPEGYMIVGPDTDVEIGMKLGACYAKRWESVTVVGINEDGTITCNWDKYSAFTYRMVREDLIIPGNRVDSTASPSAPPATPMTTPPSTTPASKYSLKRYVINIPVPKGYVVVGPDTEVAVGMKLGACYAKRWEPVTVVAINEDGTITCNWDKWKSFTYRMVREDLIVPSTRNDSTSSPK